MSEQRHNALSAALSYCTQTCEKSALGKTNAWRKWERTAQNISYCLQERAVSSSFLGCSELLFPAHCQGAEPSACTCLQKKQNLASAWDLFTFCLVINNNNISHVVSSHPQPWFVSWEFWEDLMFACGHFCTAYCAEVHGECLLSVFYTNQEELLALILISPE